MAHGANSIKSFLREHPDLQTVEILLPDMNGVPRGKRVARESLDDVIARGLSFPGSVFALDVTGATVDGTGLLWSVGDADHLCRLVEGSLAPVPWARRPTAQALMSMFDANGSPFFADPRHVLAGVVSRLREIGLRPCVACELEFYLVDPERGPDGAPRPVASPKTGERETQVQLYGMDVLADFEDVVEDIAQVAAAQGVPAYAAVAENAPGQFEINLHHVDDAVAAVDHAFMLKRLVRAVARRHGMEATFMAKPFGDLAGNGMHVHVSLLDEDGANAFETSGVDGALFRHAVGGLMATMPDMMAVMAPHANSYRRFQPASYVPMAPSWGINNRTTALRVPWGEGEALRIEHRLSGADTNPYLTVAAVLAGIHHGVGRAVEPPPPVAGNAAELEVEPLPLTWREALLAFEQSAVARDYFGERFVHVYKTVKWAERAAFDAEITPLEYRWYLRTA